jgi:hypothetical protein
VLERRRLDASVDALQQIVVALGRAVGRWMRDGLVSNHRSEPECVPLPRNRSRRSRTQWLADATAADALERAGLPGSKRTSSPSDHIQSGVSAATASVPFRGEERRTRGRYADRVKGAET